MSVLYEFGEYGPIILILISWYVLWNKKNLFFYYNIGLFSNAILNIILKGIIQEPRPMFDNKKINLMKMHSKSFFLQNGIPFDIYGMPSGHAQASFFSTIFIYLALKQKNLLYIYLPLSLLICYQRVIFNYHSISQVMIGAIVGSLFAYFVYILFNEKIKGIIREKLDDNGPI